MEKLLFSDGLFEFIETEKFYDIKGENKKIKRNFVRRPPGVRAIIVDKSKKKILLSKEFRYELNEWDYRLPGGKVFDSIQDYKEALTENSITKNAEKAVIKEVLEEVGFIIRNPKLIKISTCGATVTWDLYYYEITEFKINENGTQLEENEFIDGYIWKDYNEIIELCLNNKVHEDRTVGVLLSYILNKII